MYAFEHTRTHYIFICVCTMCTYSTSWQKIRCLLDYNAILPCVELRWCVIVWVIYEYAAMIKTMLLFFLSFMIVMNISVSLPMTQQWTMTIVDRSSENSDHESVQLKRSPFSSGDVGMDGSCSSSWAVGPAMPGDSPRLKAQGGCVGPSPGAVVYNSTPTSMDRPKDQGLFKCVY